MKKLLPLILLVTSFNVFAKPIAENADSIQPLLNGQMIPDVKVVTTDNTTPSLKALLNGKKSILFFYRGGWCPFCNTQMGQLKKIENQLADMGFQLIGISTDSVADLKASIKKQDLNYQLLSDYHSTISQAFGLAYFASEKTTEKYVAKLSLGNPLQTNKLNQQRLVLPAPAIYIIDQQGLVQFNYVNPNFKVRLHEELLLKAASLVK